MESNASIYHDLPLSEDRICVRLLTILPGEEEDEIRCRLKVATLSTFTKYEALSYTWVDAIYNSPILVNSQRFFTTTNLAQALKALRLTKERRTLWIDAVNINQSDMSERAAQFKEMGNNFKCAE